MFFINYLIFIGLIINEFNKISKKTIVSIMLLPRGDEILLLKPHGTPVANKLI